MPNMSRPTEAENLAALKTALERFNDAYAAIHYACHDMRRSLAATIEAARPFKYLLKRTR